MSRITDLGATTKREITDEGYLKVSARIARTGIYDYLAGEFDLDDAPAHLRNNPRKIVKILRKDEDVFEPSSMQSFTHKPVTNNHPNELVDASTVKKYQVGFSLDKVYKDEDIYLAADLLIQDADALGDVQNGKVEVSNGYDADIVWESGYTDSGDYYDGYMTNIRGNHIALVDRGRAGSAVRLSDKKLKPTGAKNMPTRMIDGITVECTDQSAEAIDKLQGNIEGLENQLVTAKSEKQSAVDAAIADSQKTIDRLEGELEAAKAQTVSDADIDARVAARSALLGTAKVHLGDADMTGKSDVEIKKEVVLKVMPSVNMDGKSNDYVEGLFSAAVSAKTTAQRAADALNGGEGEGDAGDKDPVAEAQARHKQRTQDAWKGGDK